MPACLARPLLPAPVLPAIALVLLVILSLPARSEEAAATQLRLGYVPHAPGPSDANGLRLSWQSPDDTLDSLGAPSVHADVTPVPGDVIGSLGLSFGALEMTWSQSLGTSPMAPPASSGGQAWMGFSFRF